MSDVAQALREQVRVAIPGGTVSAVACFCHGGGLPHYHGRYPLAGNQRIDELSVKLDRIWRKNIRPELLGVDHTVPNLDLAWQFKEAGLQEVQVNGHLSLVSPGDNRIPAVEGANYAIIRQKKALDRLVQMQEKHGRRLARLGFSQVEFEELLKLKRARLRYMQEQGDEVRQVMEVFTYALLMVKGKVIK
ncbi:MAG: hypothetical protein R3293_09375 [Candidatus Promineifilaceae bacterium]|nr:hypothetical protein [Candidatus Promineifilaceae bacterium]